MLVYWYGDAGRTSAALPLVERLLAIDPLNPYTHWAAAWVHEMQGEFELALDPYQRMHSMAPDNPILRVFHGQTLAFSGRLDEACSMLDPLVGETPQTTFELVASLFKAALQGEEPKALESIPEELKARLLRDEIVSWWMAECCALFDERQRALGWLEHAALSRGFINYPFLSETDPFLKNLRGEEQFEQLMDRVRYEWEHFEA
jgi:tetratricopeptide (TPR) repeat protein